jgi:hypothetical protein
MYGDAPPTMLIYYTQKYLLQRETMPDVEHHYAIASQLIRHFDKGMVSFLLSETFRRDALYYSQGADGRPQYDNWQSTIYNTYAYAHGRYNLSPLTHFDLKSWGKVQHYKDGGPLAKGFGTSLSFATTIDRVDFYGDLIYKYDPFAKDPAFNVNMAITYHVSRRLSLFLKADNILGQALKEDYFVINPLTGMRTDLENVNVLDRRVWTGFEYQF